MRQDEFDVASRALLAEAARIQTAKRPGYTLGNTDVLHNFKSVADRVGITPAQAWAVYATKHYDAILSGMCRPDLPVAEALLGRFADLVNYAQLGWGLLVERETRQRIPTQLFSFDDCAWLADGPAFGTPDTPEPVAQAPIPSSAAVSGCAPIARSIQDAARGTVREEPSRPHGESG